MTGRHAGLAGAAALVASGAVLLWFGVNDLFGNTDYGVRIRCATGAGTPSPAV